MENKRIKYGAVIRHNEQETDLYHKLERLIYPLEQVGFAVLFDKEYYAHGAFNEIWRRDDDVPMFQCTDLKRMMLQRGIGDVVGFFDFPEFPSLKSLSSILEVDESYMQIIDKSLYFRAAKESLITRLQETTGHPVNHFKRMKLEDLLNRAYSSGIKVETDFKIRQRQHDSLSYEMLLKVNPLFTADFFTEVIYEKAMGYLIAYETDFNEMVDSLERYEYIDRMDLDRATLDYMSRYSSEDFGPTALETLRDFAKKIDDQKFISYKNVYYPSLIAHLKGRTLVRNYHLDLVSYIYRLISMYFSKIGDFSIELVKRFVSEELRDLKLSIEFSEAARILKCVENFKSTFDGVRHLREGIGTKSPLRLDESKELGKILSELTLQSDEYTPFFIVKNAAAVAKDAAKNAAAAAKKATVERSALYAAADAARTDVAQLLKTSDFCLDMDRYLTLRKDCPCCYDEIRLHGRYNAEFHGTCCKDSKQSKKGKTLILPHCQYGVGNSTLIEQMSTNPYEFMFLCGGSQIYHHKIQENYIVISRKLSGEGWPSSTAAFGKVVNMRGIKITIEINGGRHLIDREFIAPAPRYKPFYELEGIRPYTVAIQSGPPLGFPKGEEILRELGIRLLPGELQEARTPAQARAQDQAVDVGDDTVLSAIREERGAASSIEDAPFNDEQLRAEVDAVLSKEEKRRQAEEQKKLQDRKAILGVGAQHGSHGGGGGGDLSGGGIKKGRNTKKKRNIKNKRSMKKEKYTRKRIYKL